MCTEMCKNFQPTNMTIWTSQPMLGTKYKPYSARKTYRYLYERTPNPSYLVTSWAGGFDPLALPPFILILVHNELKRTPIKVAFYSLSNTPIHNVTQKIREHARMKQVKFKT